MAHSGGNEYAWYRRPPPAAGHPPRVLIVVGPLVASRVHPSSGAQTSRDFASADQKLGEDSTPNLLFLCGSYRSALAEWHRLCLPGETHMELTQAVRIIDDRRPNANPDRRLKA